MPSPLPLLAGDDQQGDLMAALDTVLAKIDANLESALGRLFKLVEIPSISTDPT